MLLGWVFAFVRSFLPQSFVLVNVTWLAQQILEHRFNKHGEGVETADTGAAGGGAAFS